LSRLAFSSLVLNYASEPARRVQTINHSDRRGFGSFDVVHRLDSNGRGTALGCCEQGGSQGRLICLLPSTTVANRLVG
jgi:hypothetical protein